MAETKNFKDKGEGYDALGEELLKQQDLAPVKEGKPPEDAPVTEIPVDDAIYMDPPEVSDRVKPIQDPPAPAVPAGEYNTFSAAAMEELDEVFLETEESSPYQAMDGGAAAAPAEPALAPEPGAAPASPAVPPPEAPAASPPKDNGALWQTILRPVVALLAICLITSLLLGLTNSLTSPIIAANAAAADDAARKEMLPAADGFEAVPVPEGLDDVTSIYRATNGVGWIVGAYGRGYGGQVPALVAFDESGAIAGVTFTENSETVGLGQKVREPYFYTQFAGRPADSLTLSDIDKIASATISSNAAISAVNTAVDAYHQVNDSDGGQAARPTETADVLAYLLPGQELTTITISAQDVQPTAYRGENGDYIIFGEKPPEGEYGGVVVAAVAMNGDGEILNLWLDTSGESKGYGQTLATDQRFLQSFIGQTAPARVDVVADITNSSNSVMAAVNNALDALPLAKEAV